MTDARAPTPRAVICALVVVQVAFASWSIVGKVTLHVVSPLALVSLRILGGALFFGVAAAVTGVPLVPPRGERVRMAWLGLLGLLANQLFYVGGLARTSAINATLVGATIPLVTVAYAVASRRERGRTMLWVGLAIALSGVLLVARPAHFAFADRQLAGDALLFASTVAYSVYLVQARDAIARHGAARIVAWVFLAGAALIAPFGVVAIARECGAWSARTWGAIAYVVAGPTVVAYAANAWALGRARASVVAVFIYLQPALAITMAVTLGNPLARWLGVPEPNESLTLRLAVGCAATFAGVRLAARR